MVDRQPTLTVLQMGQLHFTGNVIPHTWYQHLTKTVKIGRNATEVTRPYLEAIIILSDICYWYRPREIRDEQTGTVIARERRFYADKLQRSYQQLADMFGLGKDQARNAVKWLEERKLITTELRDIHTQAGTLSNVMFIEPNPREIAKLNAVKNDDGQVSVCKSTPPLMNNETYTGTSPENTSRDAPSGAALDDQDQEQDQQYPYAEPDTEIVNDVVVWRSVDVDTEAERTCPKCGERYSIFALKERRAVCPQCGMGVAAYEMDSRVARWLPPQGMRNDRAPTMGPFAREPVDALCDLFDQNHNIPAKERAQWGHLLEGIADGQKTPDDVVRALTEMKERFKWKDYGGNPYRRDFKPNLRSILFAITEDDEPVPLYSQQRPQEKKEREIDWGEVG